MKTRYCPKCKSKNIDIDRVRANPIKDSLNNIKNNMLLGSIQTIFRCKDCGYEGGLILENGRNKKSFTDF